MAYLHGGAGISDRQADDCIVGGGGLQLQVGELVHKL